MMLRLLRSSEKIENDEGRLLAVVDACVQISALITHDEGSTNVRVMEAAAGGLFVCVLSEGIKADVVDAMAGAKLGRHSPSMVEERMRAVWQRAEWVEMADPHTAYAKAVRDPDDEMVLRTAGGVLSVPRLATMSPKYIVTNNTRDFKGRNFYGFRVRKAHEFWLELVEGLEAAEEAEDVS